MITDLEDGKDPLVIAGGLNISRNGFLNEELGLKPNNPYITDKEHWAKFLEECAIRDQPNLKIDGLRTHENTKFPGMYLSKQPDIILVGKDINGEVEAAVKRAQEEFSQFFFIKWLPIHVFILKPEDVEFSFRRFGSSGEYPYAPAISSYGMCAINNRFFEPDLLAIGRKASQHEIHHAFSHMYRNQLKTNNRYHPATDINTMVHEAVAALPPECWSDIAYQHLLPIIRNNLKSLEIHKGDWNFGKKGLWLETNFWRWLKETMIELNVDMETPFFLNPVVAAFHHIIYTDYDRKSIYPKINTLRYQKSPFEAHDLFFTNRF